MAIPSRQIGWSTNANLLWTISKELDRLICVRSGGCTTTTTTAVPPNLWSFVPAEISVFPVDSTGYTLYEGAWTNYDDGQTVDTFPLAGEFYNNNVSDVACYLSTNGYMIFPNANFSIYGNQQDLFLTPGDSLFDGDIQNFWYKNTVIPNQWKTSVLVYCGHCCGNPQQSIPYSYVINIYRDNYYQYVEACAKTNVGSTSGPEGVVQIASTATQVWKSNLSGTDWTYLGYGYVQ